MRNLRTEFAELTPGGTIIYHIGFLALDCPQGSGTLARQALELARPIDKGGHGAHLVQRRLGDKLYEYQIRKSHREMDHEALAQVGETPAQIQRAAVKATLARRV